MTIFAVVGWVLFAFVAILYYVGNKINNQETNALAVFSLTVLLSDDFRSVSQNGFEKAIQEGHSAGIDPKDMTFRLMKGVTNNAKNLYTKGDAPISTIDVVINAIEKSKKAHQ